MVNSTTPVPNRELQLLLSGFVVGNAELILADHSRIQGEALHPGDAVGKIITWLWRTQPGHAALRTADLMAQLRDHSPHADSTIRLADFLAGLRFALPPDVDQREADQLITFLREEVPAYYGSRTV